MIVPNKVISYEESLLPKLPTIFRCLSEPISPNKLYELLESEFKDVHQFVMCLDVLFILNRIVLKDGDLQLC